ncbi:hypothetical protein OH76DRAFT_1491159 [Lentinus brumalis]|uniref:Uncharacterized protein n=1 Tax=Lentinus brumalis TaxID=2498619 RepID=A0A371CGN0_9APHY|nr:hypothetical protein OH76DRAFT_1491159 [Polyporus brumalis]
MQMAIVTKKVRSDDLVRIKPLTATPRSWLCPPFATAALAVYGVCPLIIQPINPALSSRATR